MQDINVIRKLEFTVGELRKINIDYRKTVDNKFIDLFFDRLQSKRLGHLERLVGRLIDERSRDYWAGYSVALSDIKAEFDKLAEELDEVLKAG
jgi:hypothetical protein